MTKQTTIGQLVANLFARYDDCYHDEELAAVATQVTVDDLMRARRGRAEQRGVTTRQHRIAPNARSRVGIDRASTLLQRLSRGIAACPRNHHA